MTLAEKIAGLSPENRELVERQAEELIAQERARRAKSSPKRPAQIGNGRPVRLVVKPCYFRKAGRVGVVRRYVRQFRRGSLTRTRGVGHRRRLSMVR